MSGMPHRDENLLFAGPIAVIGTIVAAQFCARALAEWPSSSVFWYLNLQVFRPLRYGIDLLPGDGLAQATWLAAPLSALLVVGLLLKSRLPIALAAHLAFLYSALVLYFSDMASAPVSTLARAVGPEGWTGPNLLATAILLLSLLSSAVSHRQYWRDLKAAGASAQPRLPSHPTSVE